MQNSVQYICVFNFRADFAPQNFVAVKHLKFKGSAFWQYPLKFAAKTFVSFFDIVGQKPRRTFTDLLYTAKSKNRFLKFNATPSILL